MTELNNDARRRSARTRRDRDYDSFQETLAAPIPNRTYRSEIDLIDTQPSAIEQIVRLIAVTLGLLLAIRLIINLFATDRTNGYVAFFYATTGWMVAPFQLFLGQPPSNLTGGFFDWPAVAAITTVCLLSAIIIRSIRSPSV